MDLRFKNDQCANLKAGDKITLTGCNGYWTVVGVRDHHAIKVQPEDLNEKPIWVDSDEITGFYEAAETRQTRIVSAVALEISPALASWIHDQFATGVTIDEVWAKLEAARDTIKNEALGK